MLIECSKYTPTTKEHKEFNKTYIGSQYRKQLYNVLARYIIASGEAAPKRLNKITLYPFFAKKLNVSVPKSERTTWLLQLARIIERNEHKQFDLADHVRRLP